MSDREGKPNRYRSVHGVATSAKDFHPHFGCQSLARRHHPMPRGHRTERECGEREGQENNGREELLLPTEIHSASTGKTGNERSPLVEFREYVWRNAVKHLNSMGNYREASRRRNVIL
jgi:hypothetical protein